MKIRNARRDSMRILCAFLCVSMIWAAPGCAKKAASPGLSSEEPSSAESQDTQQDPSSQEPAQDGSSSGAQNTQTQGGAVTKPFDMTIKKGISSSRYGYNGAPADKLKKLTDLNVGWYYNWGITTQNSTAMEYVPMIWGAGSMSASNLQTIKQQYDAGVYHNLLTFNEPDLKEQSNMTVEQALNYWPKLEELGIRLSSPAPAVYSDGGWLDQFMQQAISKGYRVDFIALHFYQNYSDPNAVNYLKDTLTSIYNKYHLPIWITEIGEVDTSTWTGGYTAGCYVEANATKYIQEVTQMLESLGFVERYAWFVDNFQQNGSSRPKEAPFTALYNDDDTISATGKIYRDTQSQKALIINTATMPKCEPGKAYSAAVSVFGGSQPYAFSASGLPTGMSIDSKTGKITGTPQDAGSYEVVVEVKDAKGQTTHKAFQIMNTDSLSLVKLDKTGWTGIAAYYGIPSGWQFENHDAPTIVDNNPASKFTMHRTMTQNDVFQVQFGKRMDVKKIVLVSPPNQFPSHLKVLSCIKSADGKENWSEVRTDGIKAGENTEIVLSDVVNCEGLMVQLTQSDSGKTWALKEFDVYGYGL